MSRSIDAIRLKSGTGKLYHTEIFGDKGYEMTALSFVTPSAETT